MQQCLTNRKAGTSMKKSKSQFVSIIALKKLVSIVIKEAPMLFISFVFCSICLGIFWATSTVYMQSFFDSVSVAVEHTGLLSNALQALINVAIISFLNQVINFANNLVTQAFVGKVTGRLSLKIHKKISRLSPLDFEDCNILDSINKAEQGKNNAVWFVLTFFIIVCYYVPYFMFMTVYLFSLKPILSLSIFIVFIPTVCSQLLRTKVFSQLEDNSAPIRRKNLYFESCIVDREFFKETRMLGAFSYFKKLYNETLIIANKLKMKADIKTNILELFMKIFTLIGYCLILFGLFVFLLLGDISVGAFAAVFSSISNMFSIMEEVICGHIGNISNNFGSINNFLRFLNLEERCGTEMDVEKDSEIVIDNVSFRYPNASKNAIDNISFSIKKGETIAIVGENGSGKTTLIRLICGIYLPSQGSVKINGIDTRSVDMRSLFKNISVVFQSFIRYQMSLKDNITISETTNSSKKNVLIDVMDKSGLNDIKEIDNDHDIMLSKEFGGIDLSGGEWQKVAIARGLYRAHNIIVLDEPTASIDPIEESNIYNKFAEIAKDKTAIIVTHRLGSAKLAERIVALKNGKLVEIGTHSELMSLDGYYARLYKEQEHWYK